MKSSTITIRLDDALERARRRVLPLAESQGYLTDDDVFRDAS